jgi:CHAT domain-containing protein
MPEVWNPERGRKERLEPLEGANQEAIEIARAFNTQPLLGGQATEAVVIQRMQNARIIHLATHGLLEYGDPRESGVRDFPGAIALAPDNQDDGLLTSSEIYSMNLNAELVVLSACDTGRGTITGDGVIGLSRSFMQAGVPSIVVSLWQVPDAPTAELMTQFYQNLRRSPDKAQALRQAMLTTMKQHPEPRNWAAFTLVGEAE